MWPPSRQPACPPPPAAAPRGLTPAAGSRAGTCCGGDSARGWQHWATEQMRAGRGKRLPAPCRLRYQGAPGGPVPRLASLSCASSCRRRASRAAASSCKSAASRCCLRRSLSSCSRGVQVDGGPDARSHSCPAGASRTAREHARCWFLVGTACRARHLPERHPHLLHLTPQSLLAALALLRGLRQHRQRGTS